MEECKWETAGKKRVRAFTGLKAIVVNRECPPFAI
jgi:hypothetical protein